MFAQPTPDNRTQAELLNDLRYGSPHEQEEALIRLAAVGEAEALDAVVDYLREQPPVSSSAALEAIRVLAFKYLPVDRYGLAEVLIPYLSAQDWRHRITATRLLNTHPSELAVEPLRQLVHEARNRLIEEEQRRHLSPLRMLIERTLSESIIAVANCGRLLVLPDILEMLDHPGLRAVATRALGVIGSETERLRLEDLIEDDNVQVRDAAQWALGLMDERIEMFTMPPDQIPQPPPDRLHPIYWAHRQLQASEDDLLQFLIVRIAIEHLTLDHNLSEGRVPETCLINVRCYEGNIPPDFRRGEAKLVGIWRYVWQGPFLTRIHPQSNAPPGQSSTPQGDAVRRPAKEKPSVSITVSYSSTLSTKGEGLVGFDCLFGPFMGRGWIYRVALRDGGWTFSLVRRTWAS